MPERSTPVPSPRGVAASEGRSSLPDVARLALLRGLCLGGLLVGPGALFGAASTYDKGRGALDGAVAGLCVGLLVAPVTAVDVLALRRASSARRDLLSAASALALAIPAIGLAALQACFMNALRGKNDHAAALEATRALAAGALEHPALLLVGAPLAFPVAQVVLNRLRARSVAAELGAALGCGLLVLTPTWLAALACGAAPERPEDWVVAGIPVLANVVAVALLSAASRGAARLDRALERRLAGAAPVSRVVGVVSP